MTKIVIISACQDCPHASHAGVCLHPDILDDDGWGQRLSDEILKDHTIPDWCPLDDDWHPAEETPEEDSDETTWYLGYWESQSPKYTGFYDLMLWCDEWIGNKGPAHKLTRWKRIRGAQ